MVVRSSVLPTMQVISLLHIPFIYISLYTLLCLASPLLPYIKFNLLYILPPLVIPLKKGE